MFVLKMFWVPFLFAMAMCAPGVKDPYDVSESNVDVSDDVMDVRRLMLDEITKWLYKNSEILVPSGVDSTGIGLFLSTMEEYMAYKTLLTSDDVFNDPIGDVLLSENEKADDSMDFSDALKAIFEYIDENIEEILEDLIYTVKITNERYLDYKVWNRNGKSDLFTGFESGKVHAAEDDVLGIIYKLNPTLVELNKHKRNTGNYR